MKLKHFLFVGMTGLYSLFSNGHLQLQQLQTLFMVIKLHLEEVQQELKTL
jgi:hypothetical protein